MNNKPVILGYNHKYWKNWKNGGKAIHKRSMQKNYLSHEQVDWDGEPAINLFYKAGKHTMCYTFFYYKGNIIKTLNQRLSK